MRQNVQTNASIVVNIWVEHFRHEANLRSFIWIVFVELDDQIEDSALPNRVVWSKNDCFPLEERVAAWSGLDALLRVIVMHLLQVLEKSAFCVRTHLIYFINYNLIFHLMDLNM